jgi:dipeptidyl aminopeptidase/acylaminoacyl peptidase
MLKQCANANSDIYLYDTLTTTVRLMTEHQGDALFSLPEWLPDSKTFYFASDLGRQFKGLAMMNLDSAKLEWVETPDWDVERVAVSKSGRYRAWTVNADGYSEFHLLDGVTGKTVRPYRLPKGIVRDLKFSPDSQTLLITFGSGKEPDDIYAYSVERDYLSRITFSAVGGVLPETFVKPDLVHYSTFDGRQIPAFFYKPVNPTGKMPVIVYAHGGPESQARPTFSGLFQYFLSRGYAVFEPNVRGSTGYGKDYMHLDNIAKRMDAITDVEYGARWLTSQKDIDATKLIIMGGSYGGFVALSSLVTYPERWAAGVDIAGIANFVSFLENTGPWRQALREAEYGSLEYDSTLLKEISPLTHVDKIRAPLFIVQGANDQRVPQPEADQIYEAVKARGIPVEYALYPDEGHGLVKLSNRINAYTRMIDFLDAHVMQK